MRSAVSLAITVGLLWLLREAGLKILPSKQDLTRVDPWGVAGFVALWFACTGLRVYRWLHLIRAIEPSVPRSRVLAISLLGFSALFAPMRMGELARPILLARDKQIGFVQALGTVVAERIVDGVVLMLILAAGLATAVPLDPLPDHLGNTVVPVARVPQAATVMLVFFLCAFGAMVVFYFWRATARRLVLAVVGVVSKPLATFVTTQVERVSDSLHFLMSRKYGVAFVRDTLGYWGFAVLSFWVLLRASGASADIAQAAVILGVLGLGTLLPGPPGFLGTFQFGAYCGIAMFFAEETVGVVFTFIAYVTQIGGALISLLLGLWILSNTRHELAAVPEAQRSEPALSHSSR